MLGGHAIGITAPMQAEIVGARVDYLSLEELGILEALEIMLGNSVPYGNPNGDSE